MDSEIVRRAFLDHGGDATATAETLGTTRQAVTYHVARANARIPGMVPVVNLPGLDPADPFAQSIARYVRLCLDRAGILKERPA